MGFFSALKKFLPKVSVAREYHNAPSQRFATQTELIEYLIERIAPDGWASFEAEHDGATCMMQVTPNGINTCTEEVDVPAIAKAIGLEALAEDIRCSNNDRTLHELPDASLRELAEVVHGIFLHHFHLPQQYRVEGWLEQ